MDTDFYARGSVRALLTCGGVGGGGMFEGKQIYTSVLQADKVEQRT